jgi:hypothetical protein
MRSLSKGSCSSTVLTLVCAVWLLFGSNRVAMRTQSVIHSPNGSSHSCARLITVFLPPASLPPTRRLFVVVVVVMPSLLLFFCFISTLGNAVYSRLIRSFLLCPSWERRAPLLLCFACLAGTKNSGSCGAICLIFLGGGWPDDVRFPRRSGDSPPLVAVS